MMNPPSPPLARVRTPGFAGYGIAWSPFFDRRLAVASSANYGLVGNGRLHILSLAPNSTPLNPNMMVEKVFDTQDGLYDLAFSEAQENQLVTASGDDVTGFRYVSFANGMTLYYQDGLDLIVRQA